MCDTCNGPASSLGGDHDHTARGTSERQPSRRALLTGAAAMAGGMALALAPTAAHATGAAPAAAGRPPRDHGLDVVLLGTKGGPPPDPERAGIASAVVVDGAVYLVDAGRAAATQYYRAGLEYASLAGMFITHLHADHIADYFNVFMLGGHAHQRQRDSLPDSTPVYGPGPAGGLPPTFGGGTSPTTNPKTPTPGLASLTDSCAAAYAYHTNLFLRDSGIRMTRDLMDVHEITLPPVGASFQTTAPDVEPFVVMEDDRVRVSAVLVPHGPAFPSFAFRFDTDHGSVTFSGDTTHSANLLRLARGSDVLVHEAINIEGFDGPPAFVNHLIDGHVQIQEVGSVAQAADVERLVISHVGDLGPSGLNRGQWQRWAQQGYDGVVSIGEDLDVFGLG